MGLTCAVVDRGGNGVLNKVSQQTWARPSAGLLSFLGVCVAAVQRPCSRCGQLIPRTSACPRCGPARSGRKAPYQGSWSTYSAKRRAEWIETHGPLCQGWDRPPHNSDDLCLDHDGLILCRTCNSVKGATFDKARAKARREATRPGGRGRSRG